MTKLPHWLTALILCAPLAGAFAAPPVAPAQAGGGDPAGYAELVKLFGEWRVFERPSLISNVPDYSARAMAAKAEALKAWRKRLDAIDTRAWPTERRNDGRLVAAELSGLDPGRGTRRST